MMTTTAGEMRTGVSWRRVAVILATALLTTFLLTSCDALFGFLLGQAVDDYETNDSFTTAHAIERDQVYAAYIAEDDADYFSFTTAHGSTTFDELEIRVTNVGDDLMIGIAVFDPDGEELTTETTSTAGADLTLVLRDLQATGSYRVRFSGTWGDFFDVDGAGDYRGEGPYTFRVSNLNANDEFAGNHSLDDAATISLDTPYSAVLVSDYEADYFSFTPTTTNMQLLVTEVGSDLHIGVAVYNEARVLQGEATTSTAGADMTVNMSDYNTTQTYYLRFTGTWGDFYDVNGAGDFDGHGPYTFTLNEVN